MCFSSRGPNILIVIIVVEVALISTTPWYFVKKSRMDQIMKEYDNQSLFCRKIRQAILLVAILAKFSWDCVVYHRTGDLNNALNHSSWMTIRVSLMICMGRYDGIILEYTNAWFIKKITKIPSCWFQNCQLRWTTLVGAQYVLERAWHLESTLDNNVLLQYLDAVLFDQYLCKGNILHHTLIVKYLILRIFSQVCGRMSSHLSGIPGPRRWVV